MKKLMTIMLALAMTAGASAQQKSENSDTQAAINNIMTRTSIRQYTDEPVSKADNRDDAPCRHGCAHSRQQTALAFRSHQQQGETRRTCR